jgi:hypothetical protein
MKNYLVKEMKIWISNLGGCSIYCIKKKILQRPKEFYLKVVEMLDKDINPIEGFVIERFHKLIFN